MDLFVGQRVALVHEADRDMAKKALLVCLTDLARHQDLTLAPAQIMEQLERYHLASDDYEELMDAILEHPSPEKTLDGDPYIKYRALYHRRQKTATTSTSLPSSVTGDTGQMHTDNQALSGPALSIDFIPLEPGVMCSYCGHNQAECTVNQATLCLDCAENRWGIPVQEAMNDPGTPGDAPQEPSAAETSAAMELDPRTVDAIEKTGAAYTGDHVFKFRPFEGDEWEEGEHKLEAWPKEHAHWADTEDANDRPAEAQPDGAITWHNQTGAIQYLGVRPHAQRQGLASELYHRAGQAADEHGVIFPEHSQERTVQGDAWARSLHQHLPENQLSEEHEPPHIAGLVDWLLGKVKPLAPGAPRFEHSWCRFRSADRCWKSGVLDNMATQQMGYAVWQPRDMGPCGRATKAAQKACGHSDWGPGSEPGPGSNDPQALTDATTAFGQGGQRDGTPGPVYRYASNDDHSRSAMVSLDLPDGLLDSTEKPCHCTVVYLGKDLEGPRVEEIAARLQELAAGTPGPLTGTVGGLGTFPPSASSDWKTPVYAIPQIEGINELRSHLEDLNASEHKEFSPHVTLKYAEPWDPMPIASDPTPVSFDHLTLHNGDDVRHFPFAGKLGALHTLKERRPLLTHPDYYKAPDYEGTHFLTVDQARAAAPKVCPCGQKITWDPIDGPQHEDGSVTHEDGDSVSDKVFHRSPEEIRDRRTAIGDAWLEQMKREGSWNDVVQKAKRLRETNAVHILEVPTPQSPYVFAEVKGDTAVHHCFVAVKGGEQGQWSCSCPWGDYGPNGPLAEDRKVERYKKTPCSHVLATRWELQSRSMFGRNPYTGALHEAMAMVDPEMWRQPKPQWDLDEHKRYTDAGDDDKASQQHHEYYTRKKHWEHSMDSALSMGHITPDEAVARGHRPANYDQDKEYGRDSGYQPQGWQEMPHTMYHVTTNAPAVREHGLKTRHELDQGLGAGLGGGEDSTISFTDNEDIAHDIHRGIHEMRQVARGERTVHHMIDEARTGKDAKRPFLNDLTRQLGQGEVGHRELDRLTRGVTRNRNSANPMRPKEPGDWAPAPDAHVWKHGTTGETLASRWERPSTEDEKREDAMQFAKSFSAHREHAGGPSDPLFFTADTKGLANIPAHHIQILKVHPRPGARGYPMSGMKEWRTSAGGAVDVEPEPVTPRHQIEREASVDPLETWFEGRFLVEARGPQDHSNLENYMAPHRHPAGEEWSTKNMSGTYPSNPRATHFEDLPDHDQTEVAGKVHKALSEAPTIPNTSAGGARNPMPAKPYDAPQTHDDISHNIEDMFHSARISDENEGTSYLKSGREWYGQAHKQVHKWAKQYGIDPHRMAAATACLSPSTDWDSNLTMAHYYVHHLGKTGQINNESFHMNKDHPDYQKDKDKAAEHNVDLDGLEGKRFEDMTDMEAHHAVKHQAMRVDKVTKAYGGDMVEESDKGTSWQGGKFGARAAGIIRGTSDPDKALSGHKVRSFYNNIYHPGKTDDVTVDSHATSLAVGAKMGAESKTLGKVLEFGGSDRERKHNSLGGYSYMASAYRKAHSNLVASGHMDAKSTPADLQAITWKRWRDLMPAAAAGKKGHTPSLYTPKDAYPVLASLQDDDDDGPPVDESPEHYLDPMGGPDEPDPDLHAREEPDWEDAPEDDEDDEEDDDGLLKVGAMYDWTEMLRSARRERLAEQVVAPYQPPQVPVQYLTQQPHHLSSGYDEWGFEAPSVHQAGAAPSAQWQEEHSSEARNPGDTAPHDFGAPLDPNFRPSMLDRPYSDEKLLEPGGVATGGPFRSHMPAGYEVMTGSVHYPGEPGPPGQYPQVPTPVSRVAQVTPLPIPAGMSSEGASILAEHQAGLDYLRPPEGSPSGPPGASVGTGPVSREAALAQDQADKAQFASAAEQFLQTGSIAAPGMMINMDNIFSLPQGVIQREARSRDFTPSEQEEMVKEGELEGVRASNYGMLRLDGSMYEELERQLQVDEQSQSSAYDLFGG